MNKEIVLSIVRSILTAVGAYMAGKYFLGTPIDDNLWLGVIASSVTLISVVWGIADKSATVEAVQSGLRSVVMFVGALLVGSGVFKGEVLESTLAIISVLVPILYSQLSKIKSKNIAEGSTAIVDLKGVKEIPITPNTTAIPKKDLPK